MIDRAIAVFLRIAFITALGIVACGLVMICRPYPHLWLLVAGIVAWRRLHRWRGSGWSHGSATMTGAAELDRSGLMGGSGLILGRCLPESPGKWAAIRGLFSPRLGSAMACRMFLAAFFGKRWYGDQMIRANSYVHLATFAPAGAGKGIGVLIPNLKSYRGSCVVVDPKGELHRETSWQRRWRFGHRIIRLDPFGVCGPGSDTLNPLDFIDDKAGDFLDACRELAATIIQRTAGGDQDPHWNDSAELMLTAFAAFVRGCESDPKERHFGTIRGIASSRKRYATAINVMQQMDDCQGVIRRLGGLLTWFAGEELGSVLTTFQRHTAFMDSPEVVRNTASSSFDPMILRKRKATVYLILPADRLVSHARLQALWISTIMRRITAGVPTEKNPVLWLLDEMAHIGRMQAIEDAVTLKRGMGMRLWFFFQSLDQLKTCFGDKATTVLDNIGTQQYFGITSYDTAEALSKRIGDTTISIESLNTTTSDSHPTGSSAQPQGGSRSTSRSTTTSDTGRRLLKPEEILTLSDDILLLFHKNLPVIPARLLRFFDAPEFKWGGSGKQRGFGLAASVMAVSSLAASVVFVNLAASLPQPQLVRRTAVPPQRPGVRQQGVPHRQPLPYRGTARRVQHRR